MRKATIGSLLLLNACASAAAYRAPEVKIPAAFQQRLDSLAPPAPAPATVPVVTGDSVDPVATHWRSLGDTTLDRLLGQALRGNLDVEVARSRIRGARAARTGAALDFVPTVTAVGGYTRQRLAGATFPIGSGTFPDQDIWDAGFDASWEVDLFGRVRRGVQARGALVGAAEQDLRDVRVSLAAELARVYFELRGAQEQLAVAERNAENQRRSLQLTRERLEGGRGTAFDTERALAQLSITLATVPPLEARVAAAQYRIGVLTGRPPADVATELRSVAAIPQLPATVAVAAPDSLIRRRPDVAAAERRVAAEHAFVGSAKAEYLPRVGVGGSAGFSSAEVGDLGGDGTFRYSVGPVISWPFLNLGRVKARVGEARALEEEARARYDQTVLAALEEVETALVNYRTSLGRVDRVGEAAAASGRAAELARLRFTGGVADFLQVLDAERTQLESEDQLARARTDASIAYAALYKALGGDGS
ncbi:MAG TPA: TolC family protein [Gemmatimonadales bacterium]|jgi:NodT family efflux transporter outer membrane factor (OMF) lipoprotein|nr:TolC family protein [Gemmatimonadales bacterium]